MDDAAGVRARRARAPGPARCRGPAPRQRAARQFVAQRLAGHVLRSDVQPPVDLLEGVDGGDVRDGSGRRRARLATQARGAGRVAASGRRNRLERHLPPEPRVLGEVDHAHAAGAEQAHDPVVAHGWPRRRAGRDRPAPAVATGGLFQKSPAARVSCRAATAPRRASAASAPRRGPHERLALVGRPFERASRTGRVTRGQRSRPTGRSRHDVGVPSARAAARPGRRSSRA